MMDRLVIKDLAFKSLHFWIFYKDVCLLDGLTQNWISDHSSCVNWLGSCHKLLLKIYATTIVKGIEIKTLAGRSVSLNHPK